MNPPRTPAAGALLLVAVVATAARAADAPPDTFELRIAAELRASSPKAESLWARANDLREAGDQQNAALLYERVADLAPDFYHAKRRQAMALLRLGERSRAVALLREACVAAETPENLACLAIALQQGDGEQPVTASEAKEALALASRAVEMRPDDPFMLQALCLAAASAGDTARLRTAAEHLVAVDPDFIGSHLFLAYSRQADGRWAEARAEFERAHALGLPTADYEKLLSGLEQASSAWTPARLGRTGGWVLGIWLGGLLLLLAAGLLLSSATLRQVRQLAAMPGGVMTGAEASLRRVYRVVLWLSCLYYYVSMPILLVVVLGLGGGLIWMFFSLGRIPIKLVVIIGVLTLATAWSLLKSLAVRSRDDDPGERLDLQKHPALAQLLREVAAKVGTRAVDNVYMTPGTDIAVMERGGMSKQLRGEAERCLILGAGVLDGLPVGEFKSILAHEYGHFSNRDTAGGGFALAVRRSMHTMARNLAESGAAAWYNPAWLFVLGFNRVFLRVSQGASRLQEVLADRWAALAYGSASFVRGLARVIERSVRFDVRSQASLKEVVEQQRPLRNLYAYELSSGGLDEGRISEAVGGAMNAEPSPYDSHPSPADRIAWVEKLNAPGEEADTQGNDVWSLFSNREDIERGMTELVRRNVAMIYGVEIAAGDQAAPEGSGPGATIPA